MSISRMGIRGSLNTDGEMDVDEFVERHNQAQTVYRGEYDVTNDKAWSKVMSAISFS
jgi:hypothetical protein